MEMEYRTSTFLWVLVPPFLMFTMKIIKKPCKLFLLQNLSEPNGTEKQDVGIASGFLVDIFTSLLNWFCFKAY